MHPTQPIESKPEEGNLDTSHEDPLVGRVIQDRFHIDKKLGQGGMGAIYLAEHLLLKKQVAIKCLHAGLASNPDVIRRFKNEAVAASSIGHPNIVDVMDMGRFEDGTFFMVLEYLDGRDWQEDLDKSQREPASKVAHVGVQVCAALGAAAAKGIVHRDLKPENIFLIERLGDENFVKVLDFGISKIHDGSGGATKTGELMGTPYYMAPEQVLGEKDITFLADIYALGVIFFQALSGTVPFEGNTLAQVLLKIATEPSPSLEERGSGLPKDLVQLVEQMMAKDPATRPQSFQEIATRLTPFLNDASMLSPIAASGGGTFTLPQSNRSAQAFGRTLTGEAALGSVAVDHQPRRRRIWALGAAATVALGLGAWFLDGTRAPEEVVVKPELEAPAAQSEPVAVENKNTVRVQISTVPTDAEIYLDGKLLPNPFDSDLQKDGENHELLVKREGYAPETRKMLLTEDQRIVIPLSQKPVPEKQAKSPSPQPSSPKPAASPSPRPASGSSSDSTPKPIRDLERSLKKIF